MNPKQIIQDSLGTYLKVPQPRYPQAMPPNIAPWYCYTVDGGHSILGLLAEHVTDWPSDPNGYLVPIPVKSVLRGYRIEHGYVIATSSDVRYDQNLGLIVPQEDNEY